MKQSTFVILLVATGLSVAAAMTAAGLRSGSGLQAGAGQPFVGNLGENMSAVASITLQSNSDTTELVRKGDQWVLGGDLAGYPASNVEVRDLLVGLADSRRLEPKTAITDRFAKLQVNDVTEAGAEGKRVTIRDSDGDVLADLIVGKAWFGQVGLDKTGRYVRALDDERAWLTLGDLAVGARVRDVVDTKIIPAITQEDVRRVTVSQPDGHELVVEREKPEDSFILVDKPADRELRTPVITGSFANALQSATLETVLPASTITLDPAKTVMLIAETFDGGTVILKLQNDGNQSVLAVEGLHTAGRTADEKSGIERSRWLYQIPKWRYDDLTKRMKDMLAEPTS
tara:strand:+ start:3547 stop:4575 length:1029 start_codon:yes stop_codon:yes gene_type:complete